MAKFRTYKNGIYGVRYKGYYISTKQTKAKVFTILDSDLQVVAEGIDNYDEAEWTIDKLTANGNETVLMEKIYQLDLKDLTELVMQSMEKGFDITDDQAFLRDMLLKIRLRKSKNLPF